MLDLLNSWTKIYAALELSMGPFCLTQSNPTNQLTDPTQPTTIGKIWTQPNKTNNRAYSLVATYFYTPNLSVSGICQIGRKIKFNCLLQPESFLAVL